MQTQQIKRPDLQIVVFLSYFCKPYFVHPLARILRQFPLRQSEHVPTNLFKQELMHIRTLLPLLLAGLFALQACKSSKTAVEGDNPRKGWKYTLAQSEQERLDFETLTLTGKAEVKVPTQSSRISASYRINVAKDSLIWIRLSKFGIEAVRVLITPDSIWVMDKLSNRLEVTDFSLAEEYTGLKADFFTLQDLILGNLYVVPEHLIAEKKKGNPHIFTGSKAGMDFRYTIDTDHYKVVEIEAKNLERDQHSIIQYEDFEPTANTQVPARGTITVVAPTETSFRFNHTKIELNPSKISFKFDVPDNYERGEP